jgi:hypothetical protein
LTGIGESQVAEILGEALLRGGDPEVATYARAEAVDVRISAVGRPGRTAEESVATVGAIVEERLGNHVWATGATTWADAIADRLDAQGRRLRVVEIGTLGQVGALLGAVGALERLESIAIDDLGEDMTERDAALASRANALRVGDDRIVGLAVAVLEIDGDCDVAIAVSTPDREVLEHRTAFLGGRVGRTRAALTTAAILLSVLSDTRHDERRLRAISDPATT